MYQLPPAYHDVVKSNPVSDNIPIQRRTRVPCGEIRLYDDLEEKNKLFELASLYSIIRTTECLELTFGGGEVSVSDYQRECNELITQFNMTKNILLESGKISSVDDFIKEYDVGCPRAYTRLVKEGAPVEADDRGGKAVILESVAAFITAKDALFLNKRAVDDIQPLISELATHLKTMTKFGLPLDFIGLSKINGWQTKLSSMQAHEELSEEDTRQLQHDLESSFIAFRSHLQYQN